MGVEGLIKLCSSSRDDFKGAWTRISECLPTWSVESIYKFCRRKFNIHNYQGTWTLADEQHLLQAVETYGHEWVKIGQLLNRTPENIWDKWWELGGKNSKSRKRGEWRLEEKLELIKLID